jgi:hypothetical protein
VGRLLKHDLKYSLQAPRKTNEGGTHPDRDAQFRYIQTQIQDFRRQGWPIISIDAKKKEKIGNFANGGREYHAPSQAPDVNVYDFVHTELGIAIPYGVYDLQRNEGFVNVGVSCDTAEFAVNSLRLWWKSLGQWAYTPASDLLITADGGGSNGSRVRLWKWALQAFANDWGLRIHVCHYPPGTSKWNKIEHRMFSQITKNWRGRPLQSRAEIVQLIAHTTTTTGLHITVHLDERIYQRGRRISPAALSTVNIERADFHGEWNYIIHPTQTISTVE